MRLCKNKEKKVKRLISIILVLSSFFLINLTFAEDYLYPVKVGKTKKTQANIKTTPWYYLDWTQGNVDFYLSVGGAGDIFAAAFFTQLAHYGDPVRAAEMAVIVASDSISRTGLLSAPNPDTLYEILRKVQ